MKNKIKLSHKTQDTVKKEFLGLTVVLFVTCALFLAPSFISCNIYKFNEATIPDSIKTVKVNFFQNRARLVNPELGHRLTDKLRQKIIGQTRLSQSNSDNPDWEINGVIVEYSFSTSAISGQQVATNRLTVGVHITVNKHKEDKTDEYDVSRSFEFKGDQSFQQAEATLGEEIVRSLTDEIFNKLFSNW